MKMKQESLQSEEWYAFDTEQNTISTQRTS